MERQSFARARLDLLNEVRVTWASAAAGAPQLIRVFRRNVVTGPVQVTAEDNKLQRALDASFAHLGAAPSYGAEAGAAPPSPIPHRSERSRQAGHGASGARLNASAASLFAEAAQLGGRGSVVGTPASR